MHTLKVFQYDIESNKYLKIYFKVTQYIDHDESSVYQKIMGEKAKKNLI